MASVPLCLGWVSASRFTTEEQRISDSSPPIPNSREPTKKIKIALLWARRSVLQDGLRAGRSAMGQGLYCLLSAGRYLHCYL